MKKLKSLFKKPTETFELILESDINWIKTLLFFSCNGIVFIYYKMRSEGIIDIESLSSTIGSVFAMIFLGTIYGILSNFIIGFLIKLTGKIFNAKNDFRKILNVLSWSYLPLLIAVLIIIPSIFVAKIITSDINVTIKLILSIIVILLSFVQAILGIWQLILLYKGLKVAQTVSPINTILNYLLAGGIFGIFYYFVINPYL